MAQEIKGGLLRSPHRQRDDSTRLFALRFVDSDLLRRVEQGWVDHRGDGRVADEVLGDLPRAFAGALHAQADGRQSTAEQPAFIGLKDVSQHRTQQTNGVEIQDVSDDD
jgi:hypothetical protein